MTFNVREGAEISPVIQALEKQQSKATFFIDPAWAPKNSDAIRHISLKRHEVGILLEGREINSDLPKSISNTKELFARLTGSAPSLVRFDEPEPESTGPDMVYSLGYQIIGSSETLQDTNIKDKEWLQPGNILCISLNNNGNYTQKLITNTISALQEDRYCQVTLSELLAHGPEIVK